MITAHALHAVAWLAIRVVSLPTAKRCVDAVGAFFPTYSVEEARRATKVMQTRGTCLTRALAVAARLPDAEVVIGTSDPRAFAAHAWIETGAGDRIDSLPPAAGEPVHSEIARLRRRRDRVL